MSWYKLPIDANAVAEGAVAKIQRAFADRLVRANGPDGMHLYSTGADRQGACLYFSPGAVPHVGDLLRSLGAVPCAAPAMGGLILLVGDQTKSAE